MPSFFTTTLSLVAALAPVVLGAPNIALRDVETFAGKVKPKGYIVTLKEGASKDGLLENLGSSVTAVFNRTSNGFAGKAFISALAFTCCIPTGVLNDNDLNNIRANPDVESIAQDGIVSVTTTQTNAPWGLARISQGAALGSSDISYNYDPSGGAGVDVYVVDTGIYTAHSTFGGRASWGATFARLTEMAKLPQSVHLIAVKVLDDSGSGYISDILAGLEWVIDAKPPVNHPLSLSVGGSASTTFDNGIIAVINAGIHIVVAARNDNTNASGTSPARVVAAITVGATTIDDARASFSNYGSNTTSSHSDNTSRALGSEEPPTRMNNISGTSMAAPHVSGLVAYLIGLNGNQSPAAISALIKSLGVSGVLSNIPSGTVNLLANNGY
ncbi:subtilisin-like protein [Armillaria solidipes]|uniref:Subtilisin-like protein n=1 Tax=Armillaria solidipes TaxID=1076256 RepID=A0A2H3BQR2_9AGAR|nr:subtilisin-like protein [Armillaria solidipes]